MAVPNLQEDVRHRLKCAVTFQWQNIEKKNKTRRHMLTTVALDDKRCPENKLKQFQGSEEV